jgi:hypothetical protein
VNPAFRLHWLYHERGLALSGEGAFQRRDVTEGYSLGVS